MLDRKTKKHLKTESNTIFFVLFFEWSHFETKLKNRDFVYLRKQYPNKVLFVSFSFSDHTFGFHYFEALVQPERLHSNSPFEVTECTS